MERLLSVPEAAAMLGISPRKTWEQVNNSELRSCRIGHRVLVRQEDIANYAEAHLRQAVAAE